MLFKLSMSFLSAASFSVIFNVEKKELPFCGIVGLVAGFFYLFVLNLRDSTVFASFIATIAVAYLCRVFSYIRQKPVTIFLTAGILNLVPGLGIYRAMYYTIQEDLAKAVPYGLETLKIAGAIAIGILLITMIPPKTFSIYRTIFK